MDESQAPAPSATKDGESAPAPAVTPLAVIEALARLLAAASVYPREHPRIAAIVEPVLAAVRAGLDERGRFLFRIAETDPEHRASSPARRLLRELDALGIARMQIDRDVSVPDLFSFAKFLRQHAGRHSGEGFRHLKLELLPWTIQVEERTFGAPTFRDDEDTPKPEEAGASDDLRTFRGTLISVDPATLVLVRKAVRAALRGQRAAFAAAIAQGRTPASEAEATRASAEAVRAWIERFNPARVQTRTPAEILADAEKTLPQMLPGVEWTPVLDGIRRVIDEYMRDAFRGETRADFDTKTVVPQESAQRAASKADLALAIGDFTHGSEPFVLAAAVDRAEQLAILLHMLHQPASRGETEGIVRRLGACLSGKPGPRERPVLVGWLRDVAAADAPKEMDARLVPVFGALRMSGGGAVAEVLLETCGGAHSRLATAFWPHVAYELITGDDPGAPARRETLTVLVLATPAARIRDEGARLATLIAMRPRPPAHDALTPPREAFHPLYEILLDTPHETGLAAAVTAAFIQHPPKHPAAGALVALSAGEERAQRFVARLIRDGETRSTALRALAIEILVGSLRNLPRRRRTEPWVPSALRALAELPCVQTVTMLRSVTNSRWLGLVWKWPPAARRAAEAAMGMGGAAEGDGHAAPEGAS
jgi:hypothetical protein